MKRITTYISGVVQGVGFRYFTRKVAKETGVKGYTMNLRDGRVLIVAEGDSEQLDKFISTARQGPPHAIVKSVEIIESDATGEFEDFTVRY